MLPLSQSHLSLLESCARRYEYVFLESLTGPASYEQQAKTQWGSQFHLLMQQQALNLPIEAVAAVDAEMSASLRSLQSVAPDVFQYLLESSKTYRSKNDNANQLSSNRLSFDRLSSDRFSQSEHRRTLSFNGYLLTAVYDLVVIQLGPQEKKGLIFDWKTHQQPPPKAKLKQDWQTRLYPYLLCETSELSPEDISMTYWFVRAKPARGAQLDTPSDNSNSQPSFYKFSYSLAEHDQTRRDLQALTDQLSQMRQTGQFSKVDIEKGLCDRCPFNVRCDRKPATQLPLQSTHSPSLPLDPHQLLKTARQLTVEDIPEIPL